MGFPAHKGEKISTVEIVIAPLNVGSTKPPAFIEDTLHIPRRKKRVSGIQKDSSINEGQNLTSHDRSLMLPKPSSPSKDPDSKILRGYCGAKELGNPGPLYAGSKDRAEEKCPRTCDENPDGLEMLPRTILSSTF